MLINSRKVNYAAASSLAFAAVHAAGGTPHCFVTDFALLLAVRIWLFSHLCEQSFSMPCRSLVRSLSLLVGKLLTKASCLKISPSASMPAAGQQWASV